MAITPAAMSTITVDLNVISRVLAQTDLPQIDLVAGDYALCCMKPDVVQGPGGALIPFLLPHDKYLGAFRRLTRRAYAQNYPSDDEGPAAFVSIASSQSYGGAPHCLDAFRQGAEFIAKHAGAANEEGVPGGGGVQGARDNMN